MSITTIAYEQMTLIFNRLPEEKKWVRAMSEGQWEDYVDEQLKNTLLSQGIRDAIADHTSAFWADYFWDE